MKTTATKPTDAFKNLGPIRLSFPTALATSSTSAPVASQRAEILLMELIRCAKKALDTSFESSDDHTLVVTIFSRGIQFA